MRIPTHQIHNVLNAYARRLKRQHDVDQGIIPATDEDNGISYSTETKRRAITEKLSSDILLGVARFGPKPHTAPEAPVVPETDPGPEEIRYNRIAHNGEKIPAVMKIQDSDFLIRNLRGSTETNNGR